MSNPCPYFIAVYADLLCDTADDIKKLVEQRFAEIPPDQRPAFIASALATAAQSIDGLDVRGPPPKVLVIAEGVTDRLRMISDTHWRK